MGEVGRGRLESGAWEILLRVGGGARGKAGLCWIGSCGSLGRAGAAAAIKNEKAVHRGCHARSESNPSTSWFLWVPSCWYKVCCGRGFEPFGRFS